MDICPYCRLEQKNMPEHMAAFHTRKQEEDRLMKARDNPETFLKERGFARELALVQQGKCPLCEKVVLMEELIGTRELNEWRKSGACGPCQRKNSTIGL